MKPDAVFDLLVEANPVPEVDVVADLRDVRSNGMRTQTNYDDAVEIDPPVPDTRRRRSRTPWLLAAAAVVIAVAIVAGLVATGDDTDEGSVVSDPDPAEGPGDPASVGGDAVAVDTAETFEARLAAGDVDGAIAMSNPDLSDLVQDRAMWAMVGVHAAAWPRTLDGCTAGSEFAGAVRVTCRVSIPDPVWIAVGADELEVPYRVFDDGTVAWDEFASPEFRAANRAYADYLVEFHPADYDAVCSPGAYEPGSVLFSSGLALTPECAEVWVPLAGEVAEWLEGSSG